VSYARNRHLGGVMIWELAQDHHAGQLDPLLQSIKQALSTPGATAIQVGGQSVDLGFASIPLGSYRVQWSSSVSGGGTWNTLAVTNVSGTGGVLHVSDPIVNQGQRFYRVQTPP
jgi:hypothetical protein